MIKTAQASVASVMRVTRDHHKPIVFYICKRGSPVKGDTHHSKTYQKLKRGREEINNNNNKNNNNNNNNNNRYKYKYIYYIKIE